MSNIPNRYVWLESQGNVGPPPRYNHRHRGSRGCGCGCLRWCCCCFFSCCRCCFCILFLFIFLLLAIVIALYYFLKPHLPSYNIENFDVKSFEIQNNNKIYSDFIVVVTAENPNEDIGLDYGANNVSIIYAGSQLSWGQFPPFLQPGKNTTRINVIMKGETDFGPEMKQHLMEDQKEGKLPLLVTVKVPIRLVINDFIHLKKFVVGVNCSLVIDQLQSGKKPNILKKDFTYDIHF